jgi:hypothetical protein
VLRFREHVAPLAEHLDIHGRATGQTIAHVP